MKMLDKQKIKQFFSILFIMLFTAIAQVSPQSNLTYPIVDTGQKNFYDNYNEINAPSSGEEFYGQDAQPAVLY